MRIGVFLGYLLCTQELTSASSFSFDSESVTPPVSRQPLSLQLHRHRQAQERVWQHSSNQ